MIDIVILIIIPFLAVIISFIGSKGQGFIDLRRKWYKVVTAKGWWVIALNLLIIILLITQFLRNQASEQQKENQLSKEQRQRDSIINEGITKANEKTFDMLSTALSKQNLMLDTFSKSIVQLKVPQTKIYNLANPNPVMGFYIDYAKNDKNEDMIVGKAWTSSGPVIIDKLEYWLIGIYPNDKLELLRYGGTLTNYELKTDDTLYNYTVMRDISKFQGYAIYFKGTYQDKFQKLKSEINQVQYYNRLSNISYPLTQDLKRNIVGLVQR